MNCISTFPPTPNQIFWDVIIPKGCEVIKKYSDEYQLMLIDCGLPVEEQGLVVYYCDQYLFRLVPVEGKNEYNLCLDKPLHVDHMILAYELKKILISELEDIKK